MVYVYARARQGFVRFVTRLGRFHHHDNFAAFAHIHIQRFRLLSSNARIGFGFVIRLSLVRASGESLVAG